MTNEQMQSASDLAIKRMQDLLEEEKKQRYSDNAHQPHQFNSLQTGRFSSSFKKVASKNKTKTTDKKSIGQAKVMDRNLSRFSSTKLMAQTHLCSLHQKYPLFLLEKKNLSERKVKNLYSKEQWIAKNNFQKIAKQMQRWIYTQLKHPIRILKKDSKKLDLSRSSEWENYIKNKEERHFQIDRIIKYLTMD